MSDQHHKFGPSSLKYVEICPGFRNPSDEESEPHPVAVEGTLLHERCETGDLEGLEEDQIVVVSRCLDYVKSLAEGADAIHRELRLEIDYAAQLDLSAIPFGDG